MHKPPIGKGFPVRARRLPRSFLFALAWLGLSGCGGGSSASGGAGAASGPAEPIRVPTAIEYLDETEQVSARMDFNYSADDALITTLHRAGDDGIWNTNDDSSEPWLDCRYAQDDDFLPSQPLLFFRGGFGWFQAAKPSGESL